MEVEEGVPSVLPRPLCSHSRRYPTRVSDKGGDNCSLACRPNRVYGWDDTSVLTRV